MSKYLLFFIILLYSPGCFSKSQAWLSEGSLPQSSSSIPSLNEFASADLNKDNVIDRNESAVFLEAQNHPDYTTPLIAISGIIGLIALCCWFSSVRFFFKSKYHQLKYLIFKK